MRVAMISTYPPIECGIATYTSFLIDALKNTTNEFNVISQYGAMGENVYAAYGPMDSDLSKKIYDMTVRLTPDIIHIQHEYGLYGEMNGIAVLDLIYRFKSSVLPVVATLHTVHPKPTFRMKMILSTMCRELDAVIVHEQGLADLLVDIYDADISKIHVIPHGAREISAVENAKEKLGLVNKKVVLLVGYFRPTKCFEKIVDLFPRIVERCPDSWLVISGKMRMAEFSEYRNMLFDKISSSPVVDRMEVFRGQFPQKTFDTIISASDVMVFPYSVGAQSGVMAHAYAFKKPVVTSALPAFKSMVEKSQAGFSCETDDEYVDKIVSLLQDEELYEKCADNAGKYVKEKIAWRIVAEKTLKIYKEFDINLPRSRYVYEG